MSILALIPYYSPFIWELGPLVLDSWALLVSIGFIFGLEVARARGLQKGLDVRDVVDSAVFVVAMGFLVGHIVHVVAYNPHQLEEQGIWAILKVWAGFSSTGGFIGAVLGCILMFQVFPAMFGARRAAMLARDTPLEWWEKPIDWMGRPRAFWPHADVLMYSFPFGWTLGRLGCFSAHDHVGARSDFFLAVDFPAAGYGGPRHDLGLYEALWTAVIAASFYALRKLDVRPGFFVALWCALYAPARLGFDFLRHTDMRGADVRWLSLTPAQWGSIAMAVAGVCVLLSLLKNRVSSPSKVGEE
jgi:phosphatidylglycerol:prolipoprotein diacylglycerol transferase